MPADPHRTPWSTLERAIFNEEDARPEDEPATATAPHAPCTVLVVDDDEDMRTYLAGCLDDRYHIIEADNGHRALEALQRCDPCLIISDIIMPGLDGYALCRALQTDPTLHHVPVLLITGETSEATQARAEAAGATAFLLKPFNARTLNHTVDRLLRAGPG